MDLGGSKQAMDGCGMPVVEGCKRCSVTRSQPPGEVDVVRGDAADDRGDPSPIESKVGDVDHPLVAARPWASWCVPPWQGDARCHRSPNGGGDGHQPRLPCATGSLDPAGRPKFDIERPMVDLINGVSRGWSPDQALEEGDSRCGCGCPPGMDRLSQPLSGSREDARRDGERGNTQRSRDHDQLRCGP